MFTNERISIELLYWYLLTNDTGQLNRQFLALKKNPLNLSFSSKIFVFLFYSKESYTSGVEESLASTSETAARLGKAILLYTEPEQVRIRVNVLIREPLKMPLRLQDSLKCNFQHPNASIRAIPEGRESNWPAGEMGHGVSMHQKIKHVCKY